MAIREGAWDCPVCGRKRNRGPEKFCGGCGSPRGPEVTFYLPEDSPEVAEAEALKRAQAGPDWVCPYCDADNPADHEFCSGCGAPRDADAKRREVVEHKLGEPAVPPPPQPLAAPAGPAGPGRGGWLKKGCGIGCLGLILLAGLIWLLGRPSSTTLTVTGYHWSRTIPVEELRPVTEEAWEGQVPAGARVLSQRRDVHHVDHIQIGSRTKTRTVSEQVQTGTERVKTGSRDLGNGYFEDVYEDRPVYESRSREESYEEPIYRDQPVYRQRIRYVIEKWQPDREAKAEGDDHDARWPDPALGEKEREGTRKEEYEVLFRDAKGKDARYKAPNEQEWRRFEVGRSYKGKVYGDGRVAEVK
ncbi:MAG: zinc ribbon domain-containing protein [Thermoanaerobaculia bacterium]